MSRFYFAGHNNFGNRGCEALVRSTVSLLESSFNTFEALTPTADIKSCDAVLMTGGDVISLEYSLGSLFLWSTIADSAIEQGVPVVLWAASVGPFFCVRIVERYMVE